jgi:hypothetical protein
MTGHTPPALKVLSRTSGAVATVAGVATDRDETGKAVGSGSAVGVGVNSAAKNLPISNPKPPKTARATTPETRTPKATTIHIRGFCLKNFLIASKFIGFAAH